MGHTFFVTLIIGVRNHRQNQILSLIVINNQVIEFMSRYHPQTIIFAISNILKGNNSKTVKTSLSKSNLTLIWMS